MTYRGGCHCGQFRFEVEGELSEVNQCNCSLCTRTGAIHWVINPEQFRLLTDMSKVATYVWNTGTARHYFCPACGIAVFRVPRRDPSKRSVNVRCIDGVDLSKLKIDFFDGRGTSVVK
jgi:hypothetical protein